MLVGVRKSRKKKKQHFPTVILGERKEKSEESLKKASEGERRSLLVLLDFKEGDFSVRDRVMSCPIVF